MTRIEADADARVVVHLCDDRRELLERRAERGALSRRMLQDHHRLPAAPRTQQPKQRAGDQLQPLRFAAARVAARMQHDAEQPERLRAIELVAHRLDRLRAQRGDRRREIDQVARVRHHRAEAAGLELRPKLANLLARNHASAPLVGVLREDLKGGAAMKDRAFDGARKSARHRHVRAEPRHRLFFISRGARRWFTAAGAPPPAALAVASLRLGLKAVAR